MCKSLLLALPQEETARELGISNNNRHFFLLLAEESEVQMLRALTASETGRPVNFLADALLSMYPIYGLGEIACNANLLVMPLSLGREGGLALVAPIKGCQSALLRENLRNDDRRLSFTFVSQGAVATLCSSLNLQRA